ncbi:Gfo/Idh/MocA family protein [Dactylosporangium cerinum]|uniref:Gfo/Idh/MocA family protein n=1 Tax=Dactylosporangium cerinum TaxID=1434730 RepID=A0ABV9WA36_9ACTN
MKVGVIGCGYWGAKHVRVLSSLPEVSLVVAIDAQTERIEPLRRMYPSALCVTSLDEVIDLIDAAIIATPPRSHAPLAKRLLAAGKHVMVEKPMTASTEEARELVAMADEAGLTLATGHTFEHNAVVKHLRDMVAAEELGKIYYIDTARLNLGLYQPDVNVVWDLAPHDISIINMVLDSTPTAVSAWGASHAGTPFEDVAYLRLEYGAIGATANIHVSWLDPSKVRRVTVVGSQRMAVYDDMLDEGRLRIYDKGVQGAPLDGTVPMSYRYGGITAPHIPMTEPLGEVDRDFVQSALTGRTPQVDGRRGLAVVEVLEAAAESMATGRTVEISQPANV